jgi:acetyl-CoA acetyltransferase
MAGVGPSEIDVAGIYDCFSGVVLIELEDLGLCPVGEAGAFVTDGEIRIGGTIPVNTNGGLLSYCHPGYPGGLFHVLEVARQLMGRADRRQVEAEIGLVHNMGGIFSTNSTLILGVSP